MMEKTGLRFQPSDLLLLIGRELHSLLSLHYDWSANPRDSKLKLCQRIAKRTEVREYALAQMKGDELHRILMGMGRSYGNPRASKAQLAKQICTALAKRNKLAANFSDPSKRSKKLKGSNGNKPKTLFTPAPQQSTKSKELDQHTPPFTFKANATPGTTVVHQLFRSREDLPKFEAQDKAQTPASKSKARRNNKRKYSDLDESDLSSGSDDGIDENNIIQSNGRRPARSAVKKVNYCEVESDEDESECSD
eukprot:CAMPEP_0175170734 /NCGR_PEP_ID=MMETSP0087-20121206/30384_1 /TAXON_ID=136419 /ORGANISM="Unknown Unknown, Strain D1" /LENGTH=249 /DNA_ID=CAMNT_0016461411 /DNA_START=69 /DNA_END=818 /DNA_ORIENTATION=+